MKSTDYYDDILLIALIDLNQSNFKQSSPYMKSYTTSPNSWGVGGAEYKILAYSWHTKSGLCLMNWYNEFAHPINLA